MNNDSDASPQELIQVPDDDQPPLVSNRIRGSLDRLVHLWQEGRRTDQSIPLAHILGMRGSFLGRSGGLCGLGRLPVT